MKKQILVSGVRASSQPHIGNYLGAMRQNIALQEEYDAHIFIADLHALTTAFEPSELRKHSMEIAADYLALGLDPRKCTFFLQSHIAEHAELSWVFNCITPLGELYRMTQFKEKSGDEQRESILAGLLNYPVLMAADILVYKAAAVPVGEDQVQHLELARIIARKFNNRFGETFPEPKPVLAAAARVKSLMNPEKKMSKTGDEPLYIADTPDEIRRKIKKAVTATDASGTSAGVENLMFLLKEFSGGDTVQRFEKELKDNSIKFSELKEALAESIIGHFAGFREKREAILADTEGLARILADGAEKAREKAHQTIDEVKQKVGLL